MRKNTQDAFKAWQAGRAHRKCASIWTDGKTLFSYGASIVRVEGGRVIFNQDRYSVTTSCHQNGIRLMLAQNGIGWEPMDNG